MSFTINFLKKYFHISLASFFIFSLSIQAQQIEHVVDIPILGQARLTGELDILKNEYSLQGELIGEFAKLDFGPLRIDKLTVMLSNTKGLGITARGTLFNKSVEIGIKEIKSTTHMVFDATFIDKPSINILPSQKITLEKIAITIDRPSKDAKPTVTFSAQTRLFNQDVTLSFGTEKIAPLGINLKEIAFQELLQSTKNTILEKVLIKDATFKIRNIMDALMGKKKEEEPQDIDVEISGMVDFSSLGIADIKQDISSLVMKATFNKIDGFQFAAELTKDVSIPYLGMLKDGKFELGIPFKKSETKPKLILSGRIESVVLPKVGTVDLSVSAALEGKNFDISAALNKDITLGQVTIGKPSLRLVRDKNLLIVISGDATIRNYQVLAEATINFGPRGESTTLPTKPQSIKLVGTIKSKEPIRPFKNVKIPGLPQSDEILTKALVLREASVGLDIGIEQGKEKSFFFSGKADVFNVPLDAKVIFTKVGGKDGVVFKGGFSKGWKISDSIKKLAGTKLDDIQFKNPSLFISSIDGYIDEETKQTINKGISLLSGLSPQGALEKFKKIPNLNFDNILVYGTFSTDPSKIKIGASLPDIFNFENFGKGRVKSGGVIFEITGKPSIALKANLLVKPTKNDSELLFTGEIQPEAEELKLALTMEGFWDDPFGIAGLSIGNMALQTATSYKMLATGVPISGIGMTGSMKIGSGEQGKQITLAVNLTENEKDTMLFGELKGLDGRPGKLSMQECVDFSKSMAIKAAEKTLKGQPKLQTKLNSINKNVTTFLNKENVKKILSTSVRDVEVKIVPYDTKIGQIQFKRGLTFKGILEMLGKEAGLNINIDTSGILAEGWLSEINLANGAFKLSGAGRDMKRGTPDDGAYIKLLLKLNKLPEFIVSCDLELLKIRNKKLDIALSKNGFKFELQGKLHGVYATKLYCKSSGGLKKPDFSFKGELQNDFRDTLRDVMRKILENRIKKAKTKIARKVSKKVLEYIEKRKPLMQFKQASIEGSLQDLIKLKPPRLKATVMFLDSTVNIDMDFRFKDVTQNAVSVIKKVIEKLPGYKGLKVVFNLIKEDALEGKEVRQTRRVERKEIRQERKVERKTKRKARQTKRKAKRQTRRAKRKKR